MPILWSKRRKTAFGRGAKTTWPSLSMLLAALVLFVFCDGFQVATDCVSPFELSFSIDAQAEELLRPRGIVAEPVKVRYGAFRNALLFSPTSQWATVGDIFTFDLVVADPGGGTEVTMNISFDPAVLRVVDTAGNHVTQLEVPSLPYMWRVVFNQVNNSTGRISYIVDGWPMSLSGTTILGRLRFKKVRVAASTTVRYVEGSAISYKYNPYPTTLGSAVVTGPSDSTPPSITNIRESADPIYRQGCPGPTTVTIRADVYDASGLAWVRLSHQLPTGSWSSVFMDLESGSTYATTIGPFASTGTIIYQVKARDNAGNEAASNLGTVTVSDCMTLTPTRAPTQSPTLTPARQGGWLVLPLVLRAPPIPTQTPPPTPTWQCEEPANNTREGACGPLLSGQVYREYISSPSDEYDWFYFDLRAMHTIEVWLREIPVGNDYELYLMDGSGNRLQYSAHTGNQDEYILWERALAGRYYVVVLPADDGGWNSTVPYALQAVFQEPMPTPTPTWQCQEPVNNTLEGACGPLISGQVYREYISSPSDEFDWFYFDLLIPRTIEAWLTDIPTGCDYDLYLLDSAGEYIISSVNGGNLDDHILLGPLPAGRYYLVVKRFSGWNDSVPYALRVNY